jgi:hypothetical protein
MQGWYPPPPPPQPGPGGSGIKPGRVFLGVGIVLGIHLLTLVLAWVIALIFASDGLGSSVSGDRAGIFLIVALVLQGLLMIAALTVGIILAVRKDGGIGIGIIIGWAVGIMISPVVGFGVCVAILSGNL